MAAEFYSFDDDTYDETVRGMTWTGMGEEDGSFAEDLAFDLDDRETALSVLRKSSPVGQQARTGRNRCQQAPHGNPRTRTQTDQYQNIDNSANVVSYNTDNEYGIEYDDSNVCIDSSYLDSTGVSAKATAMKERYSHDKTFFTVSADEQDSTAYASKSLCRMSPYTKHFHMMSNAPAAFARPVLLPCSATSSLLVISPNIKPRPNCLEKAPGSYMDHNTSPSAGRPQAGMGTRDRFSLGEDILSTETHQEASCVSLTCRNPRRVIGTKASGARLSCAKAPQPDPTRSEKERNAKCPAQQSGDDQQPAPVDDAKLPPGYDLRVRPQRPRRASDGQARGEPENGKGKTMTHENGQGKTMTHENGQGKTMTHENGRGKIKVTTQVYSARTLSTPTGATDKHMNKAHDSRCGGRTGCTTRTVGDTESVDSVCREGNSAPTPAPRVNTKTVTSALSPQDVGERLPKESLDKNKRMLTEELLARFKAKREDSGTNPSHNNKDDPISALLHCRDEGKCVSKILRLCLKNHNSSTSNNADQSLCCDSVCTVQSLSNYSSCTVQSSAGCSCYDVDRSLINHSCMSCPQTNIDTDTDLENGSSDLDTTDSCVKAEEENEDCCDTLQNFDQTDTSLEAEEKVEQSEVEDEGIERDDEDNLHDADVTEVDQYAAPDEDTELDSKYKTDEENDEDITEVERYKTDDEHNGRDEFIAEVGRYRKDDEDDEHDEDISEVDHYKTDDEENDEDFTEVDQYKTVDEDVGHDEDREVDHYKTGDEDDENDENITEVDQYKTDDEDNTHNEDIREVDHYKTGDKDDEDDEDITEVDQLKKDEENNEDITEVDQYKTDDEDNGHGEDITEVDQYKTDDEENDEGITEVERYKTDDEDNGHDGDFTDKTGIDESDAETFKRPDDRKPSDEALLSVQKDAVEWNSLPPANSIPPSVDWEFVTELQDKLRALVEDSDQGCDGLYG
jgi:hypothetical protein